MKASGIVFLSIFCFSLVLNGVVVFFMCSSSSSFISYKKVDALFSAAQIISAPEGGGVEFGTVTISLFAGEAAYLQYSLIYEGRQIDYNNQYLFDGNIVGVENDSFGVKITALKEGEALLQVFSNSGFSNIANVIVRPPRE
jgi:hypothetical protein